MPPSVAAEPLEVLVVDDDAETRELLAEFLRSAGVIVATAEDGRAALAAITRSPTQYRVVLTDVFMPGADGFEVLRATRSVNPSCYVIIITGYGSIDTALRAVREGAYDYLPKPFALGQIEVLIARIRDRMALEAENRSLTRQLNGQREGVVPAPSSELAWRLDTIEERLARIEDLLQALAPAQTR